MKRLLYALVTLIATLSLSVGVRSAAWASGAETWKIVPSPTPAGSTNSSFYGVAAVSPQDVWGVGYWQNGTANAPLIEHWNGSRWKIIANPQSVTTGLAGVSADPANDAWAVGLYTHENGNQLTLIEHWNGQQWSIVSSPNQPAANALYSITALRATLSGPSGQRAPAISPPTHSLNTGMARNGALLPAQTLLGRRGASCPG